MVDHYLGLGPLGDESLHERSISGLRQFKHGLVDYRLREPLGRPAVGMDPAVPALRTDAQYAGVGARRGGGCIRGGLPLGSGQIRIPSLRRQACALLGTLWFAPV